MTTLWKRCADAIPPGAARLFGILALVLVLYAAVLAANPNASSRENHQNIAKRIGFYGVLTLGAGVLIIAGGIDLSVGSVVGLSAVALALLLEKRSSARISGPCSLGGHREHRFVSRAVGHQVGCQPFVVTLCGMFIYRGLAQWATLPAPFAPLERLATFLTFGLIASEESLRAGSAPTSASAAERIWKGLRHSLATGTLGEIPTILLLLLGLAIVTAVLLHFSVYGRYLYAIGYNEQAAQLRRHRHRSLQDCRLRFLLAAGGAGRCVGNVAFANRRPIHGRHVVRAVRDHGRG